MYNNIDLISETCEDMATGKPQIRPFYPPHSGLMTVRGRWKRGTGQRGTWQRGTISQGWTTRDLKTRRQIKQRC